MGEGEGVVAALFNNTYEDAVGRLACSYRVVAATVLKTYMY